MFAATLLHTGLTACAQETQGVTIVVLNGDTTINGQKLSTATKEQREKLLKAFKDTDNLLRMNNGTGIFVAPDNRSGDVIVRRRGRVGDWSDPDSLAAGSFRFDEGPFSRFFRFNTDSLLAAISDSSLNGTFRFRFDDPSSFFFGDGGSRAPSSRGADSPNSQSYSYRSTDGGGVTSTMTFRVSDAPSAALEKITGNSETRNTLEVQGLVFSPDFSSGMVSLSFNLPADTEAKRSRTSGIKLLDSNFAPVLNDRFDGSGNYHKQLALPKSGTYYLVVNRGTNWLVKKVVKQ